VGFISWCFCEWTEYKVDEVYEKYRYDYRNQRELEHRNTDVASLVMALPRFHNLRFVRIAEDYISDAPYSQAGECLFGAITTALSVSGLRIEELVLGRLDENFPSWVRVVQALSPASIRLYRQALGS